MTKPKAVEPSEDSRHRSRQFDGRRFRNLNGPAGRGLMEYLKWVANSRRRRWPRTTRFDGVAEPPAKAAPGAVSATFINHSTFLLQIGGLALLTDPVYSQRVGPFNLAGPRRAHPPGLPYELLPPIDCVLLSHNHYDHLDLATLFRLRASFDPVLVCALGNERFLRRAGFRKVVELDWWEEFSIADQLQVTLTPAQHFSSRHFFDRDQTLWGGFALSSKQRRIYFVGDSGYGEHFKEIGGRWPGIDVALIPIGAYEPRWFMKYAHVNPDEAVQVHLDLNPSLSVAMHFGTFQLTDEAIDEPPKALRLALERRGLSPDRFIVPAFGQTLVLDP